MENLILTGMLITVCLWAIWEHHIAKKREALQQQLDDKKDQYIAELNKQIAFWKRIARNWQISATVAQEKEQTMTIND
jgi:sensor domain CHASE-containing protein